MTCSYINITHDQIWPFQIATFCQATAMRGWQIIVPWPLVKDGVGADTHHLMAAVTVTLPANWSTWIAVQTIITFVYITLQILRHWKQTKYILEMIASHTLNQVASYQLQIMFLTA